MEAVTAEIQANNQRLCQAFQLYRETRDMDHFQQSLRDHFTEDCRLMPPGHDTLFGEGGRSVQARELAATDAVLMTFETREVGPLGSEDMLYERGYRRETCKDGTIKRHKYVTLWKKVDGKYKAHISIYNTAASMSALTVAHNSQ